MWLSCRNHGREPIFQVQTSEASRQPSKGGEEGLARPISLSTPCRGFPPPHALQRDTGRQHLHSGPRRPIFSLPTSVTKDNYLCCFRSLRLCNLLQHEGTHTLPPSSANLEDPPLFLFQSSATIFPRNETSSEWPPPAPAGPGVLLPIHLRRGRPQPPTCPMCRRGAGSAWASRPDVAL